MSPKGIRTNSGPIRRICKKFEKLATVFDMKFNQNTVKYKFLNYRSNKTIPLWFLCLRYTLYVPPNVPVPILDRF